jgi:TonB family protein
VRLRYRAAAAAALLASSTPAWALPEVYVRPVDFPAGVELAKDEKVTAAFLSGADGRTTACRIVVPSHVAALDEATCAILKGRARFPAAEEQRIVFHWFAPSKTPAAESGAQPGDPLEVHRSGWITSDDYPVAAYSNGVEGEVGYDIDVSTTGKPLRCRIRRSSRSDILDRVTCTLMMSRMIFIPAVDAKGHPREGTDHGLLSWRINH